MTILKVFGIFVSSNMRQRRMHLASMGGARAVADVITAGLPAVPDRTMEEVNGVPDWLGDVLVASDTGNVYRVEKQ